MALKSVHSSFPIFRTLWSVRADLGCSIVPNGRGVLMIYIRGRNCAPSKLLGTYSSWSYALSLFFVIVRSTFGIDEYDMQEWKTLDFMESLTTATSSLIFHGSFHQGYLG